LIIFLFSVFFFYAVAVAVVAVAVVAVEEEYESSFELIYCKLCFLIECREGGDFELTNFLKYGTHTQQSWVLVR
jgi:hypothetical protein